jgi:nicotinic acid phosphoribosyltransferase
MKIIIKKNLLNEAFEQKIYEFKFSVRILRKEEEFINFTRIKDVLRGIENVTIVRTEVSPDSTSKYDIKYLVIKAEFDRGDDVDFFLNKVLIPKIKEIPEFVYDKLVSVDKVAER